MVSHLEKLYELRLLMDNINEKIIMDLNQFFDISNDIGKIKDHLGLPHFDPARESDMLKAVQEKNPGPMPNDLMKRIFKEIFRASVEEMGVGSRQQLKVKRLPNAKDLVIDQIPHLQTYPVADLPLLEMTCTGDLHRR